jgi:dienelactone hydrolase
MRRRNILDDRAGPRGRTLRYRRTRPRVNSGQSLHRDEKRGNVNVRRFTVALLVFLTWSASARGEEKRKYNLLKTPDGVEFAVLGDKPKAPAPTLFVFAAGVEPTINTADYNRVGFLLADRGYLSVTLDAPCHGKDAKQGEPEALAGWRHRIEDGDDLVRSFNVRCTKVLDYLIAQGYTDPARVAVAGTSRGGFLALHWAAAEPRVRCAAAFSAVTELLALAEFAGTKAADQAKSLDLQNVASKLAGRPVWVRIGNQDDRVGTDQAIAFTRKLVATSVEQKKPAAVELHVTTTPGHSTPPDAHDEAAAWIASRCR